MARLLTNLSTYLQSMDDMMNEQLGEPEQSATEIRSQRRSRPQGEGSAKPTEEDSQASDLEVPPGSTGSGSVLPESVASVEAPVSQSSAVHASRAPSSILPEKDKEIELLNREILELEDRCNSLHEEVEDAWKTYKSTQEKAAIREGELHDEINNLKRAKEADKQQYLVGVEAMQSEIESLKTQIHGMSQEEDRFHAKVALLQQELALAREEADNLRGELHQTRETEVLSVSSVRDELRLAQQQVEELRAQHTTWQRNAQKRELELEKRNEELVASLTQKTRELDNLRSASQEDQAMANLQVQCDELRREVSQLKTQLSAESQEKQAVARQLLVVEGELGRLRTAQDSELRALLQTNRALTSKLAAQEQQLQDLELSKGTSAHQQEISELRQKLQSTTEQLLRKQTSLTELQTERSALRATIQDLKLRSQRLEQQLDHSRDVEEDAPFMRDNQGSRIRRRGGSKRHEGIGRALEPMGVNQNVVKAVETVDSWSLLAGSFLRTNPFARFGFMLYLIVLHLWVFVVLSMKTSALQDSMTDAPVDSTNINPA